MSLNLTPKQLKILSRIRESRLTRGYSPTMQELADELGVSKVTVFEHVEALIKKGALHRQKNKARSLDVAPDLDIPDEASNLRLPMVGSIAAGSPIEAIEAREHLDLENLFAPPRGQSVGGSTFVLTVRGDSMIDAHIADGDYVVCRRLERAPKNGDMVVALLDSGEATLKYYFKERDGRVRLQPANEKYEPFYLRADAVQFQGICIGVIRQY